MAAGTSVAMADDVQPPWWRGQWSTTSQIWEFNFVPETPGGQPPYPYLPDGPAPGGMPPLPSTIVHVTPGPQMEWIPEDPQGSGRIGIWPLSGWIDVIVDNHEPPNEVKYVWVQLTWRPQVLDHEPPRLIGLDPPPSSGPEIVLEEDLGFGWTETTYKWEIRPNPVDEMFTIEGLIDVDELVVDTWCIPERATLSLLGLGPVALIRRRR